MDIVVTVPAKEWEEWIAEGDCAGDEPTGSEYEFSVPQFPKRLEIGERCYVVAGGKLRGFAPVTGLYGRCYILRGANAVAVTIEEPIPGFRGFRYRWWERESEVPFLDWKVL